jgi:N-acetylmuramoyl-L-alanine amidase
MTQIEFTQQTNPRKIKFLVVHCTAGNQFESIADLLHGFRLRGWKKPGYHYVIKASGEIVALLPESGISNGVAGFNSPSIHVSYLGGIDENKKPVDNRTPEQKQALLELLCDLKSRYPGATIKGHRDFSPDLDKDGLIEWHEYIKSCPCFDAMTEYKHLNETK